MPDSTSPSMALRISSTELAKASRDITMRWRKTGIGLFCASRLFGERLTRSIRTIGPVTVISPIPSE